MEGRQVFEVEFSHTPAFRAIVRGVERIQLRGYNLGNGVHFKPCLSFHSRYTLNEKM